MMCSLASESNARLLLYLTTAAYVRADEQWLIRSLHFCSCVFGLGKVILKKIHSQTVQSISLTTAPCATL